MNFEVTLSEAKTMIKALAAKESILLLSAPGVGKSDIVKQAALEVGLKLNSLLGTQIAPEDVSGIPKIINERSVFCPPRILLPEDIAPFCLFLDELPAASPDVQKALYALLLERRLGEHLLPSGTWVVAAGNRQQDKALVRQISSALVNRTFLLNIKVDVKEWLTWALENQVRTEIISFIKLFPFTLMRDVPSQPIPFSTPRAWVSLSRAIDLCEKSECLSQKIVKALAFGRISSEDAALFSVIYDAEIENILPIEEYIQYPHKLPNEHIKLWFELNRFKNEISLLVEKDADYKTKGTKKNEQLIDFLKFLNNEQLFTILANHLYFWKDMGIDDLLFEKLKADTRLER